MFSIRLSLTIASLGAALAASAVPVQWTIASGGNGHYYDYARSGFPTYDAAKTAALGASYLGMPGHLAQWEDAGELNFITSTFYPVLANTSGFVIDYYEGDVRSGLALFNLGGFYLGDYTAANTGPYAVGYITEFQAVPEPASFAALGLGAVALLRRRKRA